MILTDCVIVLQFLSCYYIILQIIMMQKKENGVSFLL